MSRIPNEDPNPNQDLEPLPNRGSQTPLPEVETPLGKKAKALLLSIWEPVNLVGHSLTGDLWKTIYSTLQDTIALALALRLPGLIGKWIIGKDFSAFDVCWGENPLGVSRYACYLIVTADFALWIVLGGRIVGRLWVGIREFHNRRRQ
jgi:hypothetical protein